MSTSAYGLAYLVTRAAWFRYRWARRRAVERLARRLGASRRQAEHIAHHVP